MGHPILVVPFIPHPKQKTVAGWGQRGYPCPTPPQFQQTRPEVASLRRYSKVRGLAGRNGFTSQLRREGIWAGRLREDTGEGGVGAGEVVG